VFKMFGGPRKSPPGLTQTTASGQPGATAGPMRETKPIGAPLYAEGAAVKPVPAPEKYRADPVAIDECRLTPLDKQEVPSQRNGVIWFIGTEVGEKEDVPADRLIVAPASQGGKRYRRLMEGDFVKYGQLLAQLDDRLARDELASKKAKTSAAEADWAASEKAREEGRVRYETGLKLRQNKAMSTEDVGERKLVWDKYIYEAKAKEKAIETARVEANQAQTVVSMHEIRSSLDGIVKTIYKNPGEAVKSEPSYEPVFQILSLARLRVEGVIDEQQLPRLKVGDEVAVEAPATQAPEQVLVGHLMEVTGVAVSGDKKLIASASLDNTARIWERGVSRERKIFHHPAAVHAIACTPAGSDMNLCLTGAADGNARLWDLTKSEDTSAEPMKTIATRHGVILSVAFSPDGRYFATAGDDREIAVWETATGEPKYRLRGHSGAVTSVVFTPRVQLVSAARDNTIRVWALGVEDGRLEATLPRRSGDVPQPGVSPDGTQVLFDAWQTKSLRILGLPSGLTQGVLEETSGAARPTTFALFSPPQGDTILTAGGAEGRLQLWKPPVGGDRAHVHRYLATPGRGTPNCAAFSPDGSFVVVGTRQVLVFPRDCPEDLSKPLKGRITHIEQSLDSHQARVWAVVENPGARLMPGATVNMVKYPK
jgi:WD40 repeat protein